MSAELELADGVSQVESEPPPNLEEEPVSLQIAEVRSEELPLASRISHLLIPSYDLFSGSSTAALGVFSRLPFVRLLLLRTSRS